MDSRDGADYAQNYDLAVKLMADTLRGETLDVIGIKTGRITDVFGFEPADISVRAGRVDVMVRDETGDLYHIEEQRNLKPSDLCRFAAYHFMAVKQWGRGITDVVLASGEVFSGEKTVVTKSGRYSPTVIDFSRKDGRKRLEEIRRLLAEGGFDNWLELVFLPLYGKETGTRRSDLAEQVIRLETELFHARRISPRLLAATLVMSNKLLDKERIRELWEEIKMLDVFEVAREKGIEEGMVLGVEAGKLENAKEMLMDALIEKFGFVSPRISDRIREVHHQDTLKSLFRQVFRCPDTGAFEAVLRRADEKDI